MKGASFTEFMNTTTPKPTLETYLAGGQREFSRHASRIAEIERESGAAPGALVDWMLAGIFQQNDNNPHDWADFMSSSVSSREAVDQLEAKLRPLCEKWRAADQPALAGAV